MPSSAESLSTSLSMSLTTDSRLEVIEVVLWISERISGDELLGEDTELMKLWPSSEVLSWGGFESKVKNIQQGYDNPQSSLLLNLRRRREWTRRRLRWR